VVFEKLWQAMEAVAGVAAVREVMARTVSECFMVVSL
jgi:hypothetical protein